MGNHFRIDKQIQMFAHIDRIDIVCFEIGKERQEVDIYKYKAAVDEKGKYIEREGYKIWLHRGVFALFEASVPTFRSSRTLL